MAKTSKKSESAAHKKPASKKAGGKPPAPSGSPMINTSLAAENAAKMLAAGFSMGLAKGSNAPKQESAMFKQLKAGLNKPHAAAMSNLLDKSHGPETARTHPQMKQLGRNQTFGADVTRSGVPRRTPG